MHVVWDEATSTFKGINVFGIRMRHDLFDNWLRNGATVEQVMAELITANFDPEFYKHYEKEIIEQFNRDTGKNVQLSKKKWWRTLLRS
jgi:hypothetical protein